MNKEVLVSVAIPAYKSTFIRQAIESVINQTYYNLEIIIVNDKSPEDISGIVSTFYDSRINYYENQVNIGGNDPVANWNKCLSYAHGEFFALLCDDDLYEPTFVETMLHLAEKYPKCNVFRSKVKSIDGKGHVKEFYPSCPEWETAIDYLIDLEGIKRFQTISEFMYRRNAIVKLGGYYPLPKAWGADRASVVRFGLNGGIATSSQKLVAFRTSGLNISAQKNEGVREKIHALNLYTDWANNLADQTGGDEGRILRKRRKEHEFIEKSNCLRDTSWKNFIYLFWNRNSSIYQISNACFVKALYMKLANSIK